MFKKKITTTFLKWRDKIVLKLSEKLWKRPNQWQGEGRSRKKWARHASEHCTSRFSKNEGREAKNLQTKQNLISSLERTHSKLLTYNNTGKCLFHRSLFFSMGLELGFPASFFSSSSVHASSFFKCSFHSLGDYIWVTATGVSETVRWYQYSQSPTCLKKGGIW